MVAMKQAIPGVVPPQVAETTVMVIWPSIAGTALGRWLGSWYQNRSGFGHLFTVGKLAMLLSIPLALALYIGKILPWSFRRYRLTNRRLIIERGLRPRAERSIGLDEFDAIDIETLPGQQWYPAGELVFRKGRIEVFRLPGVPRPEAFRQTCLKAHRAYVSVAEFVHS